MLFPFEFNSVGFITITIMVVATIINEEFLKKYFLKFNLLYKYVLFYFDLSSMIQAVHLFGMVFLVRYHGY